MIHQLHANPRRQLGKKIICGQNPHRKVEQILLSEQAGDRHKTEQRGNHQVKEIITGVDRREAEQQSQNNIDPSSPGEFQAIGTGTSASSDLNTSSLRIV